MESRDPSPHARLYTFELLPFFYPHPSGFFSPTQLDRSDSFLRRIIIVLVHGLGGIVDLLGIVDNFLRGRVLVGEVGVPTYS
jgi:hypothetical protein